MPTPLTHALSAVALGTAWTRERMPPRFWWLAALCSIVPDFDVVGFWFGVRYGDLWGHRGMTHSLAFALILGLVVVSLGFRQVPPLSRAWWRLALFFALATASHGVLDALTDGGLGIAFFSPFDPSRYFLPWRPVAVSPIGLGALSPRGLEVLASEVVWLWLPCLAVIAAVRAGRGRRRESPLARPREESSRYRDNAP